MTRGRPFYSAAERNRVPIAQVVDQLLPGPARVLEIAAGTGQHAAYICRRRPDLAWQATDLPEKIAGIEAWLRSDELPGVLPPVALDVQSPVWPPGPWDVVYAANICHIVSWTGVEALLAGAASVLKAGGLLIVYGPFNRNGEYTSDGNRLMDRSLRVADAAQGLRDEAEMDDAARRAGLEPLHRFDMPANNRILVWKLDAALLR